MKTEIFYAWAIDTQSKEGHGLIGRYWWFGAESPKMPPQFEGCRVVLFKTRKIARENLLHVRGGDIPNFGFKNARVVKVKVEISEAK